MAKYSYEFKLQVVQAYLDGEGGYRYLSKKYGVPSKRDIEKWVFAYKAFGKDGLMRSRKNESYSFEFKVDWQDNHKYITFTDKARQEQGEKQCKIRNNKLKEVPNGR